MTVHIGPASGPRPVAPGAARPRCEFLLGTADTSWLAYLGVPLFLSDRRLRRPRELPRAGAPWALDSGAFTTLDRGEHFDPAPVYAARIRRYHTEIGQLAWAAPQDWMCEDHITARTGLTITEHQARTVGNYLDLCAADTGGALVVPVIQGKTVGQYLDCLGRYDRAGVWLADAPLVGVGSICRRQSSTEAQQILTELRNAGLTRLHGFGIKQAGLARCAHLLTSADSMAWSYGARRRHIQLPGCPHRTCQNCPRYALTWRDRMLAAIRAGSAEQLDLLTACAGGAR